MSNSKKSNFWTVVGTVAVAAAAIFIGAKGGGRANYFHNNFMDDSINNPTTNSGDRYPK